MNDAVASTGGAGRGQEDEQTSLARGILLLAWLSVALGLGSQRTAIHDSVVREESLEGKMSGRLGNLSTIAEMPS